MPCIRAPIRRGLPFSGAALLVLFAGCAPAPLEISMSDQRKIKTDETFVRSRVRVEKPWSTGSFQIRNDGVTVDFADSEIIGSDDGTPPNKYSKVAICVVNAKNVTIKNAGIRGFRIAISAQYADGLTIENCEVSNNYRQHLKSTPEKEHTDDWLWGHENDKDEWLRYGAGIYLKNCDNVTIKNCRARDGQNGICLVNCDNATIIDNDMSFMSGWGLAMWRSNHCKILGNRFDYCVRGYSHGVYARGQDSTGILVYEQCSDNIFAYNRATHGGDGFFLYAGHETTQRTGEGGCNRNIVYRNDFSYAVANGIEATFSDGNIFQENKLHHCVHGVWAGYSSNTIIKGNDIADCDNGVSIEHGRGNQIVANDFARCGRGVWLWWDDDKDLIAGPYGKKQGHDSARESLRRNLFDACKVAVLATTSKDVTLEQNRFSNCETPIRLTGDSTVTRFFDNAIESGLIDNQTTTKLEGIENKAGSGVTQKGPVNVCRDECADDFVSATRSRERHRLDPPDKLAEIKELREVSLPLPLKNFPEGKENIIIDEWGPYDYQSVRVVWMPQISCDESRFRVLGPGLPYHVDLLLCPWSLSADPSSGRTPAVVTLRGTEDELSATPYMIVVKVGLDQVFTRAGVLWHADWDVRYFGWSKELDPRESDENWSKITSSSPILRERSPCIDYSWGTRGPAPGLPADRFAVVATTKLRWPVVLKAGPEELRYERLKTLSDDGVRVFLDGKKAIDNWTWHVPTEDTADVNLAGEHEIRIEYFEIDGHAQLKFVIEAN